MFYLGNGAADPTFTASDIITSINTPIGVDVADVDNDGDLDIAIASNDGLNSASSDDKVSCMQVMELKILHGDLSNQLMNFKMEQRIYLLQI